jgi:hypothetical protein
MAAEDMARAQSISIADYMNQYMGGESLFLRKLVLGIPAQASSKNLTETVKPRYWISGCKGLF